MAHLDLFKQLEALTEPSWLGRQRKLTYEARGHRLEAAAARVQAGHIGERAPPILDTSEILPPDPAEVRFPSVRACDDEAEVAAGCGYSAASLASASAFSNMHAHL